MKKVLEVPMAVLGTIVGIVGLLVRLVAMATVMPVASAWHAGRLAAEREHAARSSLEAVLKAFASDAKAADEPTSGLGQYL